MKQKKFFTTRFVFHVALDEQVQVGINLRHFQRHLLMTLVSLTGDVIRHTRAVLISNINQSAAGAGGLGIIWGRKIRRN